MSDDGNASDPGILATIADAELAMSEFGVVTEARTLAAFGACAARADRAGLDIPHGIGKSGGAGWRPGPWSFASAAGWS